MKKDIVVPKVKDVYMAIVLEHNEIHKTNDWNAYIINDKDEPLEMVLIISTGYSSDKVTSTMRHKLEILPPKSYAKIEWMQEEVLKLNNQFKVTFFENNKMFEKTFDFQRNSIHEKAFQPLPVMNLKGVLAK